MVLRRFHIFMVLIASAHFAAQSAPAQQPSALDATDTASYTLTVSSQLVLRAVTVRDKKGNPLEGLTARDFTLTEDGIQQKISICEYQKLDNGTDSILPPPKADQVQPLSSRSVSLSQSDIAQYRDHRLLVLYFDMTSMPVGDQLRALTSAQTFIEHSMAAQDLVAILTFAGGGVRMEHDFTGDRATLLKTIHSLVLGEGQGLIGSTNDASSSDRGVAFGQDDGEFNIFNTDRQLAALQTAATMLGRLREKKALLYFASGIRMNGLNNQAQLRGTINAAVRAGVTLWPMDARGLLGQAPLGDATVGSPGNSGMYSGTSALAVSTNFDRSQDTLWTLASDTGGKALLNYNDLSKGIVQAQQSISSYYLVGYYTSNQNLDGRYRHIKISLTNGVSANLDYMPGYYAGKKFAQFTAADKERQLEEALMLEDPKTELTIALELNYFQLNRAEYFVPLAVKIPGNELSLARRRGADHTVIDFIGEVKDEFGATIANIRDRVDVKLTGSGTNEISKHPVDYEAGFTLFPGKYVIKFLARDDETGRIGTYQTQFIIPNLSKEKALVPLSSVVLSSQRIAGKYALFHSKKGSGDLANPLFDGNQKLIPSVTRVFHADRPMYIYLQAYQSAGQTQPLAAAVTFYKGETRVFTGPFFVSSGKSHGELKTAEFQFTVAMNQFPAGQYTCQVTVLNPIDRQASFWQTTVMVVP